MYKSSFPTHTTWGSVGEEIETKNIEIKNCFPHHWILGGGQRFMWAWINYINGSPDMALIEGFKSAQAANHDGEQLRAAPSSSKDRLDTLIGIRPNWACLN